jgi:hypothetical protein
MTRIGLIIAFLALLTLILPSLPAQDGKKDGDKNEKKEDPKQDEKKDADKKDEAKKPEPKKAPEKLVYGTKLITKIVSISAESAREISIELQERDPQKVFEYNKWHAQRTQQLARQQFDASRQTDFNARRNALLNYQRDLANFQVESSKRSNNLTSPKAMEIRAADNAKVRTLLLPIEFDDMGFQKKWTKKELDERRDKTGLPGFAVDFDALKQGQFVEVYLAKPAPAAKGQGKKKGPADDDLPAVKNVQEYVMIVIRQDSGK